MARTIKKQPKLKKTARGKRPKKSAGKSSKTPANSLELRQRLDQQVRIFETTLSAISDFAYIFDRNGCFLYANKALLDLWGLRLKDAVGKNFFDLKYPDELARRLQDQIQHVFRTRQILKDETPYTSPTGAGGYYEYIFAPVIGADGIVEVVAGSTRDITERKRTEEKLRDTQQRLDATLAAADVGTWTWNIRENRVIADKNSVRFFGVNAEDAARGPIESYVNAMHIEDRPKMQAAIQQAIQTGTYEMEYRLMGADKSLRWVIARGEVEYDANKRPIRFPGVLIDVTALKEAEEKLKQKAQDLLRLNRNLEDFTHIVSHDLQAPLNKIGSFGDLLKEEMGPNISEKANIYLQRVRESVNRMKTLITGLLAYSKVTSNVEGFTNVNMSDVFDDVMADLDILVQQSNVKITHSPLPNVSARALQMNQLLQNLFANAINHSNKNNVAIDFSARSEGNAWIFCVTDNGPGIDPKNVVRIFDLFQRGGSSKEGSGIGLTICRKIVESHGGRIWAESELGVGSKFFFTIPKS